MMIINNKLAINLKMKNIFSLNEIKWTTWKIDFKMTFRLSGHNNNKHNQKKKNSMWLFIDFHYVLEWTDDFHPMHTSYATNKQIFFSLSAKLIVLTVIALLWYNSKIKKINKNVPFRQQHIPRSISFLLGNK